MYSGNPQALVEHLRRQRGQGGLRRSSEGDELLRRAAAGEELTPKPDSPVVAELMQRDKSTLVRVVSIKPPDTNVVKSVDAFFGNELTETLAGSVAPIPGAKPNSELIARMMADLRAAGKLR